MRCLLCRFSSGQIDEQLVCFDDVCLFFSLLFSFGCLLVCVVFYLHCIFPSFCKNSAAFHLPFPDHQGAFQQLLIAPPYNPPQNDQDMSRTFGQPGAEAQADHHHQAHHQQHFLLRKLRWLLADQERGLR